MTNLNSFSNFLISDLDCELSTMINQTKIKINSTLFKMGNIVYCSWHMTNTPENRYFSKWRISYVQCEFPSDTLEQDMLFTPFFFLFPAYSLDPPPKAGWLMMANRACSFRVFGVWAALLFFSSKEAFSQFYPNTHINLLESLLTEP